jgi:hypothetical protein
MFKRKKPIAAVKEPPRVLKELKNYRFVLRQQPSVYEVIKGRVTNESNILAYSDELILQVKNTNAMEEPFWQDEKTLSTIDSSTYGEIYNHNLLTKIVREFLGI